MSHVIYDRPKLEYYGPIMSHNKALLIVKLDKLQQTASFAVEIRGIN